MFFAFPVTISPDSVPFILFFFLNIFFLFFLLSLLVLSLLFFHWCGFCSWWRYLQRTAKANSCRTCSPSQTDAGTRPNQKHLFEAHNKSPKQQLSFGQICDTWWRDDTCEDWTQTNLCTFIYILLIKLFVSILSPFLPPPSNDCFLWPGWSQGVEPRGHWGIIIQAFHRAGSWPWTSALWGKTARCSKSIGALVIQNRQFGFVARFLSQWGIFWAIIFET